jgi:type II secretory pathway predicted ATPase ExeA
VTLSQLRPYYGFTRLPLSRQIPAQALFHANTHREALARIAFVIEQEALGLLTGEVGSGKTVAARAAVASLDPSRYTVIYLSNPSIGARGLYHQIVLSLGGEPRLHTAALIPQAHELLAHERAERGKRVVVLIDEAHPLAPSQLEEIRLLTNAEMDSESPFAGIPLGQPALRKRLRLGSFAALDQRLALRYELPAISAEETAAYLRHHLTLAGRDDALLSDDAIALPHQASRGIPRALNNLAVQAPVAAYAEQKAIVDESSARAAVTEITAE